jgi:hypothetical protein
VRNAYKSLVGNLWGRDHSEDLDIDGRIILEWILGNMVERCVLYASGLG